MQKINLLLADLGPKGLSNEAALILRKAALVVGVLIALLFLTVLVLRIELARESRILSKMMSKVKESDLLAENIEDLKKRDAVLKQELAGIDIYLAEGLSWSKKLKQLSRLMPYETSLSQINFIRKDVKSGQREMLNLRGSLLPLRGTAAINTLSAFVNKIKQDKDFFADFDDLLISEIRKAEKSSIEVIAYKDQQELLANKVSKAGRVNLDVMAFEISLVLKK